MAISKERLEELIDKGATIYLLHLNIGTINKIELLNDCYIQDDFVFEQKLSKYPCYKFPINCAFETEKDANDYLEWYKEFGCIEWVERLKLPTWEEFWNSGQTIWFTGKDGGQYGLRQYNREILINDLYIGYLDKESYYKACRKAKKLFLGESK